MRKEAILFLFLISISLASAVPTLNLQNEEIQPGETLLATVSTIGEFTKDIVPSDITFFEGRKQVFFENSLKFYDGTYYFYVFMTREGNFTIKISNILYKEADILSGTTIEKQLEVIEKQVFYQEEINESGNITILNKSKTEILSIRPGLISIGDPKIIKLINRGNSQINLTAQNQEISLQPFEVYEAEIHSNETFSYFNISAYKEFKIPIISLIENTKNNSNNETGKINLKSDPKLLLTNIIIGENPNITIQLFNFGDNELTIKDISSDVDFLKMEKFESLEPRGTYNLSLVFSPKNASHVLGTINITYTEENNEKVFSIPLSLFIFPKGSTKEDLAPSSKTCLELNGSVCSSNEICDGSPKFTKGGDFCCVGACKIPQKSSDKSYGWIYGILIFVALGIIGYIIYDKYKKTSNKSPKEKLTESANKYSQRISGGLQRS